MAKKKETTFKEKVLRDLRALPLTWCVKVNQVALRGTPDVLACMDGNFIALELKAAEDSHIDELQMYTLGRINECGGSAFVVFPNNWNATLSVLVSSFLKSVPLKELALGNAQH